MDTGPVTAFGHDDLAFPATPVAQSSQCEPRPTAAAPSLPDWEDLVARIKRDDQAAVEELHRILGKGIRYLLSRRLGHTMEIDTKTHDCLVTVIGAIQEGQIRHSDGLMGFVRTVLDQEGLREQKPSQNLKSIQAQKVKIMRQALEYLSREDRDILTRFYLFEQTQQQICTELGLTEAQVRAAKGRAKAQFDLLRQRLERKKPHRVAFLKMASGGI